MTIRRPRAECRKERALRARLATLERNNSPDAEAVRQDFAAHLPG
jgi:hypothetical protein